MTTTDFTTTILVQQSPKEVFKAINNVSGWWQGEVNGNTTKLNDEFSYQMADIHFSKQKIVEFIADSSDTGNIKTVSISGAITLLF